MGRAVVCKDFAQVFRGATFFAEINNKPSSAKLIFKHSLYLNNSPTYFVCIYLDFGENIPGCINNVLDVIDAINKEKHNIILGRLTKSRTLTNFYKTLK